MSLSRLHLAGTTLSPPGQLASRPAGGCRPRGGRLHQSAASLPWQSTLPGGSGSGDACVAAHRRPDAGPWPGPLRMAAT
eukprot:353158-Chlamydomonas_euryale.AAC.1